MKFSVCIDMMFDGHTIPERISLAAENKADAIEFWKWSNKNIDEICECMKRNRLSAALMNLDSADEALSYDLSRGILSHGRRDDLVRAIHETAPVMRKLGMDKVIVLAGDRDEKIPYDMAVENTHETLNYAASAARDEGMTLVLEPLNSYDRESYCMPFSAPAFDIVKSIGSENVKVLLDLYHTQRMEGNLIYTLEKNIDLIGHFHVANSPWRCEPSIGEIDYKQVLSAIEGTPYSGYIGFEYRVRNGGFSLGKYIDEVKNGIRE